MEAPHRGRRPPLQAHHRSPPLGMAGTAMGAVPWAVKPALGVSKTAVSRVKDEQLEELFIPEDKGNYSPLSWNDFFQERISLQVEQNIFNAYVQGTKGPLLVLLHGGGYSGLTWAPLVNVLKDEDCVFLAYDAREHGLTETVDGLELSCEQQVRDCVAVTAAFIQERYTKKGLTPPDVHFVGHSMGGAIAGKAAASRRMGNTKGCVVIDVVEGTALSSLVHMHTILSKRPSFFHSVEEAVRWNVASGSVKSSEAARVSVPGMLRETADGQWTWRIDLAKTEEFWRGWFEGLSDAFLSSPGARLLLLAGTDRLDKPLTIGQMQGKFQMVTLPACGHVVQEDNPIGVAKALKRYLERCRPLDLSRLGHH